MERQTEKDVLKQAIQEWLDAKFAAFGRWSFWTLSATALAALVYFILTINGWKPPT